MVGKKWRHDRHKINMKCSKWTKKKTEIWCNENIVALLLHKYDFLSPHQSIRCPGLCLCVCFQKCTPRFVFPHKINWAYCEKYSRIIVTENIYGCTDRVWEKRRFECRKSCVSFPKLVVDSKRPRFQLVMWAECMYLSLQRTRKWTRSNIFLFHFPTWISACNLFAVNSFFIGVYVLDAFSSLFVRWLGFRRCDDSIDAAHPNNCTNASHWKLDFIAFLQFEQSEALWFIARIAPPPIVFFFSFFVAFIGPFTIRSALMSHLQVK